MWPTWTSCPSTAAPVGEKNAPGRTVTSPALRTVASAAPKTAASCAARPWSAATSTPSASCAWETVALTSSPR